MSDYQTDSFHSATDSATSVGVSILRTMRPEQWVKNLFVAAPLFFSGELFLSNKVIETMIVVVAFCAASAGIYFVNDILDRAFDRLHELKSRRPIASGSLSVTWAWSCAATLFAISLLAAAAVDLRIVSVLTVYTALNVFYSVWLKHVVVVDVFVVAAGYVLRIVAGGIGAEVVPSVWLMMATFLLAVFLSLGKRRQELITRSEKSGAHRPVLEEYTTGLLDQLISVVTPLVIVTYVMYTMDPEVTGRFQSDLLYGTSVFVLFGVFRYLYCIHVEEDGESPTALLMKDRYLLAAVLGWIAVFYMLIYG